MKSSDNIAKTDPGRDYHLPLLSLRCHLFAEEDYLLKQDFFGLLHQNSQLLHAETYKHLADADIHAWWVRVTIGQHSRSNVKLIPNDIQPD